VSLSAKDRHALRSIEARLGATDRRLASMLDTFTRHVADEAMPARERLRAGWQRLLRLRRPRCLRAASASPPRRRRASLLMVLWAVISIGLVAVAAAAGRSGPASCAPYRGLACPARPLTHSAPAPSPGG
jgi:hypothetical protein